ncbi:hypothetical protein D1010_00865 [Schleiferilactobacillus harbinensis]|uniref:Uncharacterized protein n=1 Tax=Schleiferilactobacillus harbinensis TaxID=304207 RepID=A0A5P8M0X6_9LACO|nr:hypothetical protein D1010_00865 [Schleiferilactobacillus harbinensis]
MVVKNIEKILRYGAAGAVPRQVDSSNIKRSFSGCSPIRGELVTDFGSPQGLPFLIQELS